MTAQPDAPLSNAPTALIAQVARATGGLGTVYAASLAVLERVLPIKPGWVAMEVIGGVLIVGLPVMLTARAAAQRGEIVSWHTYEQMVVTGFVAAGVPICLWQMGEYLLVPNLK